MKKKVSQKKSNLTRIPPKPFKFRLDLKSTDDWYDNFNNRIEELTSFLDYLTKNKNQDLINNISDVFLTRLIIDLNVLNDQLDEIDGITPKFKNSLLNQANTSTREKNQYKYLKIDELFERFQKQIKHGLNGEADEKHQLLYHESLKKLNLLRENLYFKITK